MNSYQVWLDLKAQHNTVEQLKGLMQPFIEQLETISKSLGEDGIATLKQKKDSQRGVFNGPDYTDDEKTYLGLEEVIEKYSDAIKDREALDLGLLNPQEFKGFIDANASRGENVRFAPIHKQITLYEPYAIFFRELKKLRQQIGRHEITESEALDRAKVLEQQAGLKGVVSLNGDKTAGDALLKQMEKDVDSLRFKPDYSNCYDSGDNSAARGKLDSEIRKFFDPIRNGLTLKPIPPVEVEFQKAVDAIIGAVPGAVLGKKQEHGIAERPAVTEARRILAQMASQDPDLRKAVESFLRSSEANLRDAGHIVINVPEGQPTATGSRLGSVGQHPAVN